MNPIRILHPSSRMVRLVKPNMLERSAYRGYVRAPWDCVCPELTRCRCDQRPKLPAPDQVEAAVADLRERIARFAEAGLVTHEELGTAEPVADPPKARKGKG